jgi:hypothetical protein
MTALDISATGVTPAAKTDRYMWGGICGIVFGPLLAASVFMTSGMPQADNAAKVQAWAVKHTGLLNGAAFVSVAGVIVGLCFLTAVHALLVGKQTSWMGSLYLVGLVVFGVAGTVAVGINATLGAEAKHLTTGSLQLLASLAQNLNWGMTSIGLAVMYFAAGHLIRRTNLLPVWLAWVSWLFALLAATYYLGFIPLVGTLLWSVVVGIMLMSRRTAER